MGVEGQSCDWRGLHQCAGERYWVIGVWILSSRQHSSGALASAGLEHAHFPGRGAAGKSRASAGSNTDRAGRLGKDAGTRASDPLPSWDDLHLGHGTDGLYTFVRAFGVACP